MYYPRPRDMAAIKGAMKAASNSQHRCRHGATIRKASRVATGYNKIKNSASLCYGHSSTHAEIDALNQHCSPRGGVLYSVRLNRRNELDYAAPCKNCLEAITQAKVRRVIFSNPDSPTGFFQWII